MSPERQIETNLLCPKSETVTGRKILKALSKLLVLTLFSFQHPPDRLHLKQQNSGGQWTVAMPSYNSTGNCTHPPGLPKDPDLDDSGVD